MLNSEEKKQLLDVMLKIRMAEEKIVEVYAHDQQMRTPTHLSIGQEAVAAALSCRDGPERPGFCRASLPCGLFGPWRRFPGFF